ncbi:MAG: hypothetical protein RR413_10495 [Christensenellaceae bacterium]
MKQIKCFCGIFGQLLMHAIQCVQSLPHFGIPLSSLMLLRGQTLTQIAQPTQSDPA